ncbi:MAG: MATE family efflux transporter, partial [Lachnospiraceae bacterium]|nr:MATE family efflux transporter [Lachnospiraceae bacterium]
MNKINKDFYKYALRLTIPMMIQNAISNFVGLLDNLMIGRLGTNALSGVSIANQLLFVYYLLIFGAVAGVGIFTAQYHGMKDTDGVRETFRFKIVLNIILTGLAIVVFVILGKYLIGAFLQGEGLKSDAEETLNIGMSYLYIMLIGIIPHPITMAYASTLRETGETKTPMKASLAAVFVNLVGNFILIYGYLGFPALGARGAAIATVISRFVELMILAIYTGKHADVHVFIKGAFKTLKIPGNMAFKYFVKSLPLMCNETLWASGVTIMNQCYSIRSLNAVAAMNIESTLFNMLGVAFLAMGEGVGIIIGHTLGSGEIEKAKKDSLKLIAFTVLCGAVFGVVQIAISPFFPNLYNTSQEVKSMASKLIVVFGCLMPIMAYAHASYFVIRAGGRSGITFLFDSCFVWVISVPTAFILSRFTNINVVLLVAIVQSLELPKAVIGGIMVHSGIWARQIVG